MKNFTRIILAVAAVFAVSCTTDVTEDLGVQLGNNAGQTEITLSLEASRTQLGEKAGDLYPLYWSEGDKISVNGVESSEAVISGENGAVASFSVAANTPYCIAYPAANEGQVLFADKQTHAGNGSFGSGVATMYAYSENGFGVGFKHLTGVLKIGVTGTAKLTLAQVSNANRKPIAGAFDFDFVKGEATATESSKEVIEYSFGEGVQLSDEPTYLHVAVPAGEYDELYVTLYDVDGGVMYATIKTDETKPLNAGKVREFSNSIVYAPDASVFVIKDVASLKAFAESDLSKDALFVADVDMTGEAWSPIEDYTKTVYGNGYSIKGLTAPLFGRVFCSIKGLHLIDVDIEETATCVVGAFARHITGGGVSNGMAADTFPVIEHCSVSGKVVLNNTNTAFVDTSLNDYGECAVGGFVGRVYGVALSNCVNKAQVEVKQCFPTGHTKSLYPSVGGLVGYMGVTTLADESSSFSTICDVENHGNVSVAGTSYTGVITASKYASLKPYIGGIVGCSHNNNSGLVAHNLKNYGDVSVSGKLGADVLLSGTFGYVYATSGNATNFYNYGKMLAANCEIRYLYVGGGVGKCANKTALDNIHNYGEVNIAETATLGSLVCGGLLAYQGSDYVAPDAGHSYITNSSNSGAINVSCAVFAENPDKTNLYYRVGGLSGWNQHYMKNCNNLEGGKVTCKGTLFHNDNSNYSVCIAGLVAYKTVNAIDDSRNDADVEVDIDMTTSEGFDLTKVRLNLGGISGYTNLPCRNVTNNGDITFSGNLAGQLRMGGVFGQGNSVSENLPVYEKCVNNGAVTIKTGSTIGHQLMFGGVVSYINKTSNCENNGAVKIEDNVSWGGEKTYIGGALAYNAGDVTSVKNNGPLTIGKGCTTASTITHAYIGGVLGYMYSANIADLENTANGVITIGAMELGSTVPCVGGCLGCAPSVKIDGETQVNKKIERCSNYGAINYAANNTADKSVYVGGAIGYVYEVTVNNKMLAPSTTDIHNYGHIEVTSQNVYDLKVGGVSAYFGGTTTNVINHESGTIHINATTRRHVHVAGVVQGLKDHATDLYNYADITIDGKIGHTLYGAGCITINNNYMRTRNSNYGDFIVNAEIKTNNFIGGLIYDSSANLTYIDCHNTGNFILGEKAKIGCQTRWGGMVGKLEKNAKAGEEVTNVFDGCSNSGDIIIKGNAAAGEGYTACGGVYGTAVGNTRIIILNGFVNSGDIIFEGVQNTTYVDDTTLKNRRYVELGGFAGVVGAVTFSNDTYPSWTGDFVNTGTIKHVGKCTSGVRLGGFAGDVQNAMPVITDGSFINTGDIICTGEYKKDVALGIGGIAGKADKGVSNAKVHCTIDAPNYPAVGFITGSARSESVKATDCQIGGVLLGDYDEADDEYKKTVISEDNFMNYIYGSGVTTDWTGTDNYDGCTFLSVKPTI